MSTFNTIGDFVWASDNTRDWEEEEKEQQEKSLELMYMHQLYHGILKTQQYVLRSSKLSCSYGTSYSLLDAVQDHGIYKSNLPVLTTMDSSKSNICDFGSCLCPETNYAGRLPMTVGSRNGKAAIKASSNIYAHICIPIVPEGSLWKQVDSTVLAKTCAKGYVPLLLDDAVLVCQYGGIIRIVEVPQTNGTTSSVKQYVTLAIMNSMGWGQIHCGYIVRGTGQDSPMSDKTSIIDRKFRNIDQNDIDKINNLFNQFDIATKNRICSFFAECSAETDNGTRMLEAAGTKQNPLVGPSTRANVEQWFNTYKNYGATYRGGGAIQLTWNSNYTQFKDWMQSNFQINDPDIVNSGAEYVAMTYPWEAAVFFWDNKNLNSIADAMNTTYTAGDINAVTAVVNLKMTTLEYQKREVAYQDWMTNYKIPI